MGAVGIGLVAATLLGGCETLLEPGDGAAAARNFPDVRRLATCERLSSLGKGGTRCSSSLRTTKASNCKRSNSEQRATALTPPGRPRNSAIAGRARSEEHTSELQSLMRISYAVFCLKKKNKTHHKTRNENQRQ